MRGQQLDEVPEGGERVLRLAGVGLVLGAPRLGLHRAPQRHGLADRVGAPHPDRRGPVEQGVDERGEVVGVELPGEVLEVGPHDLRPEHAVRRGAPRRARAPGAPRSSPTRAQVRVRRRRVRRRALDQRERLGVVEPAQIVERPARHAGRRARPRRTPPGRRRRRSRPASCTAACSRSAASRRRGRRSQQPAVREKRLEPLDALLERLRAVEDEVGLGGWLEGSSTPVRPCSVPARARR